MPDRLLIIGWDAADWQMIDRLIARGKMPHLHALMQRGCYAPLSSLEPKLSPLLWSSIATGVTADRHGILHFIEPDPSGGSMRISTSTTRRTKALWNILTQAGKLTHVVNWYASHPAEPISGSVVSNLFLEGFEKNYPMPARSVWPVESVKRVAGCRVSPEEISEADLKMLVPSWRQVADDPRIQLLREHLARLHSVHRAGMMALRDETAWDCTLIFQEAIDTIGHHFMQFYPPRMSHVSERDFRIFRGVMDGLYEMHDRMLGELLDAAGKHANIILLSDHGFHSDGKRPVTEGLRAEERAATEAHWHRDYGILVLSGPRVVAGSELQQPGLLDITPTALAILGCPAGADMDGRVLVEALDGPTPTKIPSWETLEGEAGQHPPELCQDPFDASDAIRQLIALGYLAALPEEVEAQLELVRRETQFNLAIIHASRGRPTQAAELLDGLVASHPHEPRYVFNLVSSLIHLVRPAAAITVLKAFLAFDPQNVDAIHQLISAYLAAGQNDKARALLADPIGKNWTTEHRANYLGEMHLLVGDYVTARDMFQLSLSIDPGDTSALIGIAKLEILANHFEEAAGFCLDALELHPGFSEAHHQLGVALAWLGSLDQAVMSFQNALALQPSRVDTLRFLEALSPPSSSALEILFNDHEFDSEQRSILLRDYPMGPTEWQTSHSR